MANVSSLSSVNAALSSIKSYVQNVTDILEKLKAKIENNTSQSADVTFDISAYQTRVEAVNASLSAS